MYTTKNLLVELLARARAVTQRYIEKNGIWPTGEEIAHIHSEVSEIYEALKHNESKERVLEEMADVIFTDLALAHLLNYSDSDIIHALFSKLQVIEKRVETQNIVLTSDWKTDNNEK